MSPKLPQCVFCSGANQLRIVRHLIMDIQHESYVCIDCYQAVINVVLAMLEDRDLWDLIAQKLNVSPPRIVEVSGDSVIKVYTEPDAPAEPMSASSSGLAETEPIAVFKPRIVQEKIDGSVTRRRSHKNLR